MSRKTSKQRSGKNSGPQVAGSLRPLVPLICVCVLIGAAVYGLERLKRHVYGLPAFQREVRLVLVDPPEWVVAEQWEPRILGSIPIPSPEEWLQSDLPRRVAERLEASGWVRRVRRVTRRMDGTIGITCDYRRPIAMLLTPKGYVPVDREGVRLPEIYSSVSPTSGWLRIVGVESPMPPVSKPFQGADARAGVALAALIFEQGDAFTYGISAIDVRNFRGRKDKRACHIKLYTPDGTEIQWGSAIGEEVEENTPAQKLAQIAAILREGGPRGRVDVSVYPTMTIVPTDMAAVESPAGRTGH